jgi:hypothetical protein
MYKIKCSVFLNYRSLEMHHLTFYTELCCKFRLYTFAFMVVTSILCFQYSSLYATRGLTGAL